MCRINNNTSQVGGIIMRFKYEFDDQDYEIVPVEEDEKEALSNYYKRIGNRLKKAREEQGITLADIANRVNLTPTAISNYESGIRQMPIHLLLDLSSILMKPVQYFLGPSSETDFQLSETLKKSVERFTDAIYVEELYELYNGKLKNTGKPKPMLPLPIEIAKDHHFCIREYNEQSDAYNYMLFKWYRPVTRRAGILFFKKFVDEYIEPEPEDIVLAEKGDTGIWEIVEYRHVTPTNRPDWKHDPYTVNLVAIAVARVERLVKKSE